jgi:hypothetical protein
MMIKLWYRYPDGLLVTGGTYADWLQMLAIIPEALTDFSWRVFWDFGRAVHVVVRLTK